jgi:Arc/MetJ family transcription regulator
MRTTLDIDGRLLKAALEATGERTKTAVIEAGLRALIARNDLLRALDEAGGSYRQATASPRRRGG